MVAAKDDRKLAFAEHRRDLFDDVGARSKHFRKMLWVIRVLLVGRLNDPGVAMVVGFVSKVANMFGKAHSAETGEPHCIDAQFAAGLSGTKAQRNTENAYFILCHKISIMNERNTPSAESTATPSW